MRIMHILPELEEGGVERHVLMLSRQQKNKGHDVYVVSAGGKLVGELVKGIEHLVFPVHSKNPFVGITCALKLSPVVRKSRIDIIHAHSRVPSWIAMLVSKFSGKPYIVTAHGVFSTRARWIYIPYRRADRVICVSKSVQMIMQDRFSGNTIVIRNGMPVINGKWQGSSGEQVKFLFVGRLTQIKGVQDILMALSSVSGNWQLAVLGDGPWREKLESMTRELKLEDRVRFHGFRDDPDSWMEQSDCLLFPSYIEGMPLTLARAVQIGMPVIASDIEPVCEMALDKTGLLKPGDVAAWKNAIENFIATKQTVAVFHKDIIPSVAQMADEVQTVYAAAISKKVT